MRGFSLAVLFKFMGHSDFELLWPFLFLHCILISFSWESQKDGNEDKDGIKKGDIYMVILSSDEDGSSFQEGNDKANGHTHYI